MAEGLGAIGAIGGIEYVKQSELRPVYQRRGKVSMVQFVLYFFFGVFCS